MISYLNKFGFDLSSSNFPVIVANHLVQWQMVKQGIGKEDAKKVTKLIKDNKFKVQAAIQGEQVRVTGKKRDDLQAVMAFLKGSDIDLPLQFDNFRD